MIPSIDTYLYNELESKLKIILSNRYIIEEILKEIQPGVAANFMKAYTGENAREIPIVYTMPQDKQTQKGAIYIGLREGEESKPSIGNIEGTYLFKEDGLRKETAVVAATEDKSRVYLEVSSPIGRLNNVENLEFAASDHVTIEGTRVYFTYDEELLDEMFIVNYVATKGDEAGLKKGFTTTEHYSVLVVSTNMDTVRCIDLIVKAILILMRDNQEESTNHLLQRLQFGQIEEIDVGVPEGGSPEILYGRESIVTYTASYSLDIALQNILEEVRLKVKLEGE
ncbi:hypothetical protein Goe7_c00740 [Bacillus phage vB_BveM-Goe7]|uniref:Uncharacterized protein n=1 Tax=Bacillus phage vB_BsuM-Goe3 TaxID=1933063 RepID=A0A217ER30_BPGO3|nr:hypothetical protein HWB07_gp233 [Bacillus phage vB_BsuM-Goe3]APZ82537.1 hypothetical protein Goe3_c07600 [Bacillus phage vB_BsuM-Goe3]QDP43099.1 hypothetical protein Goe7_c00740 [Bacillus phage vB_BveM-Goe7]